MRWVLLGSGVVALCYVIFLFVVLATVGEDHLPPGQINTVVLVSFGIAIGATTNVLLIDRVVATRTAQIDHRITVVEGDLRSQIASAVVHVDRRIDAVTDTLIERGIIEEPTGDLSGIGRQVYSQLAPGPQSPRRRPGGQRGKPPLPAEVPFMSEAAEYYELGRQAGKAERGEQPPPE